LETTNTLYNVTLDDGIVRNVLSPMSEQHLYGYLMCRPLQELTAEEVLARLEANGATLATADAGAREPLRVLDCERLRHQYIPPIAFPVPGDQKVFSNKR
jgi:hypothetical protein